MEISDIRVKLVQNAADRLKAVCSITLDDNFVVRDLKVVEGTNGLFVAMPSRKLSVHCPQCRGKNHLRARFCNECGAKLPAQRIPADPAGRMRLHRDIAHPINPSFREIVQSRVIEKYTAELELAQDPDYTPVDIDNDPEEVAEEQNHRQEPSEYDRLIASLKSGNAPPSELRPRTSPRNDRPIEIRSSQKSVAGPRPPQQPLQQRSPSPRPAPRREQDYRPAGPPREPRPPLVPRPAPMAMDIVDEEDRLAPIVETRPKTKAPAVSANRPAQAPAPRRAETPPPVKPVESKADAEDTPFGMGIL